MRQTGAELHDVDPFVTILIKPSVDTLGCNRLFLHPAREQAELFEFQAAGFVLVEFAHHLQGTLEGIGLNTESPECRVQLVHVDGAAFVLVESVEGGVKLVIFDGSIENVLYSSLNMALSICILGFRSFERWARGCTISELYDRIPSLLSSGAAGAHCVVWSRIISVCNHATVRESLSTASL